MNQRQKKKSSQSRKRHFDTVKVKESGHPSGGQKQKSKEQAKPQPAPTSQPQSNKIQARNVAPVVTGSVDSNAPPGDQRKTFSKRKVVSNWEKYDEERLGDDSGSLQESEEALQDRLLQLFNLPITHTMPSLADITDDQISADQQLDNDGSNFLTLDCRALAEALSTLPLHQRLDIDPELFPEEEREGPGEFASKINLNSLPPNSNRVGHRKDVILLRDGQEGGTLDLTASLKKFSEKEDANNCRIESDFSSVGAERQAAAPVASTEDSKHAISTNFEDEEERELDKLLSRKPGMKSLGESAKPPAVSSLKSKGETQTQSSATTEIDSLAPATVDDETSELDDMLDELLA